jgi:TonB family protein
MAMALRFFLVAVSVHSCLLVSMGTELGRTLTPTRIPTEAVRYQSTPQAPELTEAKQLNESVRKLFQDGKYKEALPIAKRVVQLREKALGADDPLVRTAIINQAEIYIALGRAADAQSLYERALKSYKKSSATSSETADVLGRLALLHYVQGSTTTAEELYRESLEIKEKVWGPLHGKTGDSIFDLAELYQITGNYKKAEPLYLRLLSIRESASDAAPEEELLEAVDRYACLLRKTKRQIEADELEHRIYSRPRNAAPALGLSSTDDQGGILNGMALILPKPSYPPEARAARVSGTVVVKVTIDDRGKVVHVCAISGPPQLLRESEKAASRATFSPTILNGKPVKVTGLITYKYVAM